MPIILATQEAEIGRIMEGRGEKETEEREKEERGGKK
jgi:hypothetical protein